VLSSRVVYTVGYGGRSLEEFLDLLKSYKIRSVVDVRRWNTSQRQPEFSGESLAKALKGIGVNYYWFPVLGGYRKFGVDVEDYKIANCFKSQGFRAYATYITMRRDVKPHLDKLVEIALTSTTALMCREKIPWLCHRKILSDYLLAKGFTVVHIISKEATVAHRLSKCATIVNGELKYC